MNEAAKVLHWTNLNLLFAEMHELEVNSEKYKALDKKVTEMRTYMKGKGIE